MSDNSPIQPGRSKPLAGAPVVRRGDQRRMITGDGSVLTTDSMFTGELDRFADARAAADRMVARLRADRADRHRRSR
ncbi:hypothetical protein ABZW03_04485 [Kitasatospora sp. NPDC004799]|uniref:hypothetical protein n=1 Tax=Kitasatospora sp. NPDC004799 TaxID=3154460 RepID=UPI0033A84660